MSEMSDPNPIPDDDNTHGETDATDGTPGAAEVEDKGEDEE